MSSPVSGVHLQAADAVELGELLEYLRDWIEFHYERAERSLDLFSGYGYDIDELRGDLARFALLMGGDGEGLVSGGGG